jgi:transposase
VSLHANQAPVQVLAGIAVARNLERSKSVNKAKRWYAGVDWAKDSHLVRLIDEHGRDLGEKVFEHSGQALAAMADWLMAQSGADDPGQIHIAIEVPHGPVVEALMGRKLAVWAINPKQMDRFRDRYSPAGAKDDSRDGLVMASALRTDPHCFRRLSTTDPTIIELREWSRMAEELTTERTRLTNRMRDQLWRYFPAFLDLGADMEAPWLLELWQLVPTPDKAKRVRQGSIAAILKRNRIRRLDAAHVLDILRQKPIAVADGTAKAACAHITALIDRIRLINRQISEANKMLDSLTARLGSSEEPQPGQPTQRDVEILVSSPGIARTVGATLLAEATDALQRRDYHALRSLAGAAPVTKRSGKSCFVVRRYACHRRLANAVFHWARVAIQHDAISRAKYAALRARGHGHARALRSVADRLLKVLCAMLKNGTTFNHHFHAQNAA